MLVPPFNLSVKEARMEPAPALGENTGDILRELMFDLLEIENSQSEGAI